jgi:small subunit ribosomal protein S6e
MPFKLNISDKEGKSWKLETEAEALSGKVVGDKVGGKDIGTDFDGYELEITGGSDIAGFPLSKDVGGIGLKRVLLTKGWGMHKRPKGDKKRVPQPKGLRLKKTVRGNTISESTVQINMKVVKEGKKKLGEVFPDQNGPKEVKAEKKAEAPAEEAKPVEKPVEAPKPEEAKPVEEKKEEAKPEEAKVEAVPAQ